MCKESKLYEKDEKIAGSTTWTMEELKNKSFSTCVVHYDEERAAKWIDLRREIYVCISQIGSCISQQCVKIHSRKGEREA